MSKLFNFVFTESRKENYEELTKVVPSLPKKMSAKSIDTMLTLLLQHYK